MNIKLILVKTEWFIQKQFFFLFRCVQESPRLLFIKNKKERAIKIVKLIAKKNNKALPTNLEKMEIFVQQEESFGTWKVWTSKILFLRNFIMSLNW